ncbi:DDE-type integrase/transposase/recombinase [Streptomyces sp. NPDC004393]
MTYLPTLVGWWYLATVIDLATREVVGYAMAEHHRAELVVDALKMAADRGWPAGRLHRAFGPRVGVHVTRMPQPDKSVGAAAEHGQNRARVTITRQPKAFSDC